MAAMNDLETKLDEVFTKQAPKLPENGKKAIVKYAPIIAAVVGVLTLLSAWTIWHWAHAAQSLVDYANQLCSAYQVNGCSQISTSRFSITVWLAIGTLVVEGALYLLAYTGLRDHKKQGWNYIYYGALINVAYAVLSLFTSYDKVGHFIAALIGSAIGFYILFQIRSAYLGVTPPAPTPPQVPPIVS